MSKLHRSFKCLAGIGRLVAATLVAALAAPGTLAQQSLGQNYGIEIRGAIPDRIDIDLLGSANTTNIPPTPAEPKAGEKQGAGQVTLVAVMNEEGRRIEQGLLWRVFEGKPAADGRIRLLSQHRDATPVLRNPPGDYLVNVSFGRAHTSRKITIPATGHAVEQFLLSVGGLRVTALLANGDPAPPGSVTYEVYSDERDQFGQRARIVGGGKPGVILRLNSGLYHLVSVYGDANATVRADFTVEPGKLTEAKVVHAAARVTFKLVSRPGGEALAGTQWSIATKEGEVVKESAGALPTHTLAPGSYVASAKSGGRVFRRSFSVRPGETTQVEVLMQ
ncbi:MAG TPA: hypothetical protein VNK52_09460 [Hyphomicrobiaceae bacterium]|nr:hypothetical protein [Hyphomicrobiaceae bacterium]